MCTHAVEHYKDAYKSSSLLYAGEKASTMRTSAIIMSIVASVSDTRHPCEGHASVCIIE